MKNFVLKQFRSIPLDLRRKIRGIISEDIALRKQNMAIPLWELSAASEALEIPEESFYNLINEGLCSHLVNHKIYFNKTDLLIFLLSC